MTTEQIPLTGKDLYTSDVWGDRRLKTESSISVLDADLSVQNPLPTDGDSVYAKDIWVDESVYTDWVDTDTAGIDIPLIPFTNLHTRISNSTTDNPKSILFHFNRTVSLDQVGLGCVGAGESFSNVKIIVLGSGGVERTALDDSANNTKLTSFNYQFGPELGNAVKIEFHTTDPVCLSNVTIQKVTKTATRLQALKPDGTVTDIDATAGGNLKVSLEEYEATFLTDPLPVRIIDSRTGRESEIDIITYGLVTIDAVHHELHEGNHYNYCDYELNVTSGSTIDLVLSVPIGADLPHAIFEFSASLGATIELYEGATGITGGTAITPRNNNRKSTNTSASTILLNPTIASDGTRAAGFLAGGGRSAGFYSRENEFILKDDTSYLIRITSLANSNDISWCGEWYEHSDE